MIYSLTLSNY